MILKMAVVLSLLVATARAECPDSSATPATLDTAQLQDLNQRLQGMLDDVAASAGPSLYKPLRIDGVPPLTHPEALYCAIHACKVTTGGDDRYFCEIDPPFYEGQCDDQPGKPTIRPRCECVETRTHFRPDQISFNIEPPVVSNSRSCHWALAPAPEKPPRGLIQKLIASEINRLKDVADRCWLAPFQAVAPPPDKVESEGIQNSLLFNPSIGTPWMGESLVTGGDLGYQLKF